MAMVVEVGLRDGSLDDVTCLPVQGKYFPLKMGNRGPHQPISPCP